MRSNSGTGRSQTTPPGRLLCLDLGERYLGIAVSDELRVTTRPLPVLKRGNWKELVREIKRLCHEFDVKEVVVGLPLKLDGSVGEAALKTREIARKLELSLEIRVLEQDERYTSKVIEECRRLFNQRGPERFKRERLDSEAAVLILNDYIERSEQKREPNSEDFI